MPAHWFYGLDTLEQTFDEGITGYVNIPHPHPRRFIVGTDYRPDVEKAREKGRPFGILHEHVRFYEAT